MWQEQSDLGQRPAQTAGPSGTQGPPTAPPRRRATTEEVLERNFAINFLKDQKDIWTSPLKIRKKDLFWLVPSAALVGESLHRDPYTYRALTPAVNPGTTSKTFSDAGVVVLAGGVAGMYVLGRWHGNDHQRETGVLATEALADSLTVGFGLKYALQRDRPFNSGQGDFFTRGGGTSFPSGHALMAWSMASVVAHEYPGVLTKLGVYGLATAVSVTRVTGRQHFPTDVLVGSAMGWGIGTMVYRKHHDPLLPGADVGTFSKSPEGPVDLDDLASTYVQLDSWVYPAFDRLAALGFVNSEFSGQRPWTRSECIRLLEEAQAGLADRPGYLEAGEIADSLKQEFATDIRKRDAGKVKQIGVDSIYARVTQISGLPLTDGYHFGQTIYNDFGRPYQEGWNSVTGVAGSATSGHWAAYLRAELQTAPAGQPLSLAVRQHINDLDFIGVQPAQPAHDLTLGRLIEAYVAYSTHSWQVSLGKQSLWWAPDQSGSLMFSNNIEPINMLRLSRVHPAVLPGFLHYLGPLRTEAFLGQLSGHKFIFIQGAGTISPPLSRQPLIEGGKLSFKPTANFEFGVSFTNVFAGPGIPLNIRTFLNSLSLGNTNPGFTGDPGDRRAGFDFKYRVPWLRDKLTVYGDSFSEDEISPLAYPRRSAMNLGFYLPTLPFLKAMDLRAEGVYTDLPGLLKVGFLYANDHYLSGYTNRGYLIGDWIGRQGSGYKAVSAYHWATARTLEFGFRRMRVSEQFLPGAGNLWDASAVSNWRFNDQWNLKGTFQYERWNYPLLAATPQRNAMTSLEIRYSPKWNK